MISNGCKQPAAALCEGCSQALCTKHFIDHRRVLNEEMNVLVGEYDQLQHTINQQTDNLDSHALIIQIDEWERESIRKVQEKAKRLRRQLLPFTAVHTDELSKKLRQLSEKLNEGREHDSFLETDLQHWKKSLDDLKTNLASPSTISITRRAEMSLVQNLSFSLVGMNELFDRVFNNEVRIEENGQVAVRDTSTGYTEIRGKNEYESGLYKIRLCVEQSASIWTFLGITSKSTPLQRLSQWSESACGWANNNVTWLNRQHHSNTSTSSIEMKTNDIISLIIDCDTLKVSMVNERANTTHELTVNTDNCPFPWQLHVILHEANSRVRILSTSP
jgi:uncharacterized protein YukE